MEPLFSARDSPDRAAGARMGDRVDGPGWSGGISAGRDRCRPESDDGVDQTGGGVVPVRARCGGVRGEGAFTLRAGVEDQVGRHGGPLDVDVGGQVGQAAVEPFEGPQGRRAGERLLGHDVLQRGVGHDLGAEPREPGGAAEGGQMLGGGTHQAGHPLPYVRGVLDPGQPAFAGLLDLPAVLPGDRAHQVGLRPEVVADRRVVALLCGLADPAVGHRVDPVLGEQPLGGVQDPFPGTAGLFGPRRAFHSPAPRSKASRRSRQSGPRSPVKQLL